MILLSGRYFEMTRTGRQAMEEDVGYLERERRRLHRRGESP